MMGRYRIDLHIHTPASNCFFGSKNSYHKIISACQNNNLDIIAVTDHHSIRGFKDLQKENTDNKLLILPGLELTCKINDVEEVFILALFSDKIDVLKIEELLKSLGVQEKCFGSGSYVLEPSVKQIVNDIRSFGGIPISSRSDKTDYRKKAISELLNCGINVFDLVYPESKELIFSKIMPKKMDKLKFFTFSDAHSESQIGGRSSEIDLEDKTFENLLEKLAQKS